MKKILWYLLLATVLMACSPKGIVKTDKSTISNAKLDAREENLLRAAAGEVLFVYDVEVGEQGKNVEIWLEKYEYGQLRGMKTGGIGTDMFEDKQILVKIEKIPESEQAIIRTSVVSETGFASSFSTIELPKGDASGWSSLVPDATILTDNMVIGQIIYAEESSFKTSWVDLNNDPEALVNELKDYPVVYLLRAAFKDVEKQE